jgi:hypothetical protein
MNISFRGDLVFKVPVDVGGLLYTLGSGADDHVVRP